MPGQEQGYLPPQQAVPETAGDMAGLAAQMGGMELGADSAITRKKRRDRHAHHTITTPAEGTLGANGIGAGHGQPASWNNGRPQPTFGQPYAGQTASPLMSQFPAPSPIFGQATPASAMQHAAHPGTPLTGSVASSTQGKVNPEQIPSIPRSRDLPARYYLEHVYPTMEQHLPPPAAIPFVAFDQGNSSPKFARLTMNNIPATSDALASTALPLGLILQPLAPLSEGEQPIPLLDFGEVGPPRCRRCRTYMNPFMIFRSGGNKFVCNMCTFPNDVPPEYFAPTDPSGTRVDRAQRPELMLGTVEFTVPKEYWAKEPVGLRWIFLIDVSAEAVNRGFLHGFCEGILEALYGGSERTASGSQNGDSTRRLIPGEKVAIVTFDTEIHFYNLNSRLSQAQMMVMSDLEEPFVPISEGLFVDPEESRTVITSLLTRIPEMYSRIKTPATALFSALNAASSALKATGGKIVCSVSTLPQHGPGKLMRREEGKVHGGDYEKRLLQTEFPAWKTIASDMVASGIGVDFFMAAPSGGYLDLTSIGHVSATTGGEIFYYPNFHATRDSPKLADEIKHTVTRETGYQALMKVRCSNGLQISSYLGNFVQNTLGADLEFGVIDADKAIGVMFSYDGKLDSKLDAHFQSALLYTTASGQRRVRCSNFVASVSEGALDSMKLVDQDSVVSIMAKEAATRMTEKSLSDVRKAITEKSISILAGYRKNFSGSHPAGQLVLPENLKEFSMYMLALIKSRALKNGKEPIDRRVYEMRALKSMGPMELSLFLYPRIIPLHNLSDNDGFANENGHLVMPPAIRASFSQIEEGGVYIVDNGQTCLLWIHAHVSPNLLGDLFGAGQTTLQALDPYMSSLPVLETRLNAQARNILQYLESARGSKALTLQLARQGIDGAEFEFARLLMEDRNNEAQNYVDWLVDLHRHIQLELAGQRKQDGESDETSITSTVANSFAGLKQAYW